jgi:hypothetical protein
MTAEPYMVYVVVDPIFGERLTSLPFGAPVWIVDTPTNRPVVERLWRERPEAGHLSGITIFNDRKGASPEEVLIDELDMIDLHHGSYSHKAPYTKIHVFGTTLSEKIEVELAEYGFNHFSSTPDGFVAGRPALTSGT